MKLSLLLLVVFGVLIGTLLFESGARVYLARQQSARIDAWNALKSGQARESTGSLSLGQFLRVSQDPALVYELMPDLPDLVFRGHPLAINSDGFRGAPVSQKPADGVMRIVGLGDSMMFGWGVAEPDGFLRRLEALLSEADPPMAVDVVNLAVPGYNTAMEVAALDGKGLAFQPDLVILHFSANDLELPMFLRAQSRDFLNLRHSFLFQDLLAPLWSGATDEPATFVLMRTSRDLRIASSEVSELTPEHYRDMVGLAGHTRAMQRLAALREEHGFQVLVTAHQDIPNFLSETCESLGLPLLGAKPAFDRYMDEHGIEEYLGSELSVGRRDPHPSAIGHALIAETIRDYLVGRI